ncbi:transposase [Microbispora sp. KK1-11]|uniref:transposase n=1 Tax=Microbispora sp. KK1-11 TaxID=2053005 RepID=UPI00115A2272|nr:transposase [Microbispora sp. KK1-11]
MGPGRLCHRCGRGSGLGTPIGPIRRSDRLTLGLHPTGTLTVRMPHSGEVIGFVLRGGRPLQGRTRSGPYKPETHIRQVLPLARSLMGGARRTRVDVPDKDGYPVHGRRQGIGDLRVHRNERRATRVLIRYISNPATSNVGFGLMWAGPRIGTKPSIRQQRPLGERGPIPDLRRQLNGVIWCFRTGSPWRDMPADYGPWSTVYDRFRSWAKARALSL